MNTLNALSGNNLKAELQALQQRVLGPLSSMSSILRREDYVVQFAKANELNELTRQLEPHRQMFASLTGRVGDWGLVQGLSATASLSAAASVAQLQHLQSMQLVAKRQQLLEAVQRQVFGGRTAADYVQQLGIAGTYSAAVEQARASNRLGIAGTYSAAVEQARASNRLGIAGTYSAAVEQARASNRLGIAGTYSAAVEQARRTIESLQSTLSLRDFNTLHADEDDQLEATKLAEAITQDIVEQKTLEDTVALFARAIQEQQKPGVQYLLWLFFCKVMELLTAAVMGAVASHYAPVVLGESPQAAKKAVQESARAAVISIDLLAEYRYVSAKVLVVRQNPKALSPELGRLTFGKPVRLLKKEKDFALVLWSDVDSGAEIQGWVFARYLDKFR